MSGPPVSEPVVGGPLRALAGEPVGSARQAVLDRVRAALTPLPPVPEIPRRYDHTGRRSRTEVLDLFAERLRDYKATVVRTDPAGLPAALSEAVATHLAGRPGPLVVPPALPPDWAPPDALVDTGQLSARELDATAGVLTACTAACAVTGTIALDGSPDQGRRAVTLVPDVHLCVVLADQVVETVPELIGRLGPTRPTTLISGPSATSDIELQRVEGVHGPRQLVVVLVAPPPS